ncbi:MAG: adenylate/guanylate cyclase domain-containing protein [Planctomycetes bacterium]|nr:adenylate/guanylate cyclase domain-containing protein [Planctomycetota bacterium]
MSVVISATACLVFFHRYLRVTRRRVDLLFTLTTVPIVIHCVLMFFFDNLTPAGSDPAAHPEHARYAVWYIRAAYINALWMLFFTGHFVLLYSHAHAWLRRRIVMLYLLGIPLTLNFFLPGLISPRATPAAPTSSWDSQVPWAPDAMAVAVVFGIVWTATHIYLQTLLWMQSQPGARRSRGLLPAGVIRLGLAIFALGGIVDIVMGAANFTGPATSPALFTMAMLVLGIGLGEEYRRAQQEQEALRRRFQSYVDPALVYYVLEHPDQTRFDGQTREMSILFTDLSGFTRLTESLGEGIVEIVSSFRRLMVPVIRTNRGCVGRFMGDGIMCFYGAPVDNPHHHTDAVRSALQMQKKMEEFNRKLKQRFLTPVSMRAGVSTGAVVVGDAGPEDASDYTVIGDRVNMASRLESANKHFGTRVLVSDRTAELVGSEFLLCPIGRLRLYGKTIGVMVYEPLCEIAQATEDLNRRCEMAAELVGKFQEMKFAECLVVIPKIESEFGSSMLTSIYRNRSTAYINGLPPADFAGEIILEDK